MCYTLIRRGELEGAHKVIHSCVLQQVANPCCFFVLRHYSVAHAIVLPPDSSFLCFFPLCHSPSLTLLLASITYAVIEATSHRTPSRSINRSICFRLIFSYCMSLTPRARISLPLPPPAPAACRDAFSVAVAVSCPWFHSAAASLRFRMLH
jgi:hypothetical protein